MRHLFLLMLSLLLLPGLAFAQDTWMSVTLQGRKVGSMHIERSIKGEQVTTAQTLDLDLQRDGTDLHVRSQETDIETRQGQVLGFSSQTQTSALVTTVKGNRDADGRFTLQRTSAGRSHTQTIDWPTGALLAEGQRLAAQRAGQTPAAHWQVLVYDVGSGQSLRVDNRVVGSERVELPSSLSDFGGRGENSAVRGQVFDDSSAHSGSMGRRVGGNLDRTAGFAARPSKVRQVANATQRLTHIAQTLHMPGGGSQQQQLWVDKHGRVLKSSMAVLGQPLVMLACDRACAMAPNQGADLFADTLAPMPRALSAQERAGALRFVFSSKDGQPLRFAQTDEQRVQRDGDGHWRVSIGGKAAQREPAPQASDTAANAWLQSDAPEIRALAKRAAGDATGDGERMQRLQTFVSHYIRHKNLSVGYASALEVMHSREGDCTEHALLLGALARALGIPTRIVGGLVYMPHFAGSQAALVPHAWVQSWVDGYWRSYDAALGGFDSGHIALALGNGDPWQFFAGMRTLGRLHVDSVGALQAARDPKADAAAAR